MIHTILYSDQHNIYEQPYAGYISMNPTIEDIKEVILVNRIRPKFKTEQAVSSFNLISYDNSICLYMFIFIEYTY